MSGNDHTVFTTGTGDPGDPEAPKGPERALPELELGTRIGRYVLVEKLGSGGMGVVYGAYDPQLDRKIAFKLLLPRRLGHKADEHHERLLREAQALARISHPNVIAVHDVGTFEDRIFVAMEYLEGEDMQAWQERTEDWRAVLSAYVHAGRGLEAVHRAGLVHRDFKPENVFRCVDGQVKVLDFGLARLGDEPVERSANADTPLPDSTSAEIVLPEPMATSMSVRVTKPGAVVGTPAFMAPEQWACAETNARTDQFSFCASLYEGLFRVRPFAGETVAALAFNVKMGKVVEPPAGSRVPKWLTRILLRGLERDPAKRWPSMAALLEELERDRGARRWRIAGAVVMAMLAGGTWGFVEWRDAQQSAECSAAGSRINETWGEVQRGDVRGAFDTSNLPYAADSLARVHEGLDDYARKWSAAATEGCHTGQSFGDAVPRHHALRAACLEERRAELATLVEVFAQADAKVIENSVRAVANLSPIETCDDWSALLAELQPPPDEASAKLVEGVREQLARARALSKAARYDDGLARADEALALAEQSEYPPAVAEAELERGKLHHRMGKYDEATTALERAVWLGTAHRHDEVVLSAAVRFVQIEGYERANAELGLLWAEHSRALLTRVDGNLRQEAELENALGSTHLARKQFEQARTHYELALALNDRIEPPDPGGRARTLNNLGTAYVELGDHEKGKQTYEGALVMFEQNFGPRHPSTAKALNNLGIAHERLEQLDEAARHHRRALDIKREIMGADHPSVAGSLGNLAGLYLQQGDAELARKNYAQARDIFVEALGPKHPFVARCHRGVGYSEQALGNHGRAIEHLELALGIFAGIDEERSNVAETKFAIAKSLVEQPDGKRRARTLAADAAEFYDAEPDADPKVVSDIREWIETHEEL